MTSDILKTDVVIIGAGPAGLLLANFLGAYGVDAVLVEKNASTVSEPRAVSIDDESMRTLQSVRLHKEVSKNLMQGYGSYYLSPSRKPFAAVLPNTREFGFLRRNAFHQDVYEAQLLEALKNHKSVRLLFEHSFKAFEQDAHGVHVNVERKSGSALRIDASYLAACDGAASPVRTFMGMELSGSTYEQKWLIIDLVGTKDPFRHTRVYCDPKRPGISLPGPKRTRRFEFMLLPGETAEEILDDDHIKKLLREHGPDEFTEIRRKCIYAFHARIADNWNIGRVSLHGDAAHLTPPFAGQGMNSGVRDIANYAWKLYMVLNSYLGPRLLETYTEERKKHAWALIEMAMNMGKVMMPTSSLNGAITRLFFHITGLIPPVRDYFAQMKYKPKPRYDRGFFINDGKPSKTTIVGRMFPQPLMATEDGVELPLDDILGTGFSVLAFGKDPKRYFDAVPSDLFGGAPVNMIAITPSDTNFLPNMKQFQVLRDSSDHAYNYIRSGGYEECAVILRPDRYVFSVLKHDHMGDVLKKASTMISATW